MHSLLPLQQVPLLIKYKLAKWDLVLILMEILLYLGVHQMTMDILLPGTQLCSKINLLTHIMKQPLVMDLVQKL